MHDHLRQRALCATPGPCPSFLALPTEVLETPAELVLDAEVLSSLRRRHEGRELALLAFGEVQAPSLDRKKLIEQSRDPLLIRGVAGENLAAQRLTSAPLIAKQLHPVALEAIVDSTELLHLRVIEVEPSLHDLGESLAKLPFERAALRRRARLRLSIWPAKPSPITLMAAATADGMKYGVSMKRSRRSTLIGSEYESPPVSIAVTTIEFSPWSSGIG